MCAVASDVLSEPALGMASGPIVGLAGIVFDVPDVFYDATLFRRWLFQLLVRMQGLSDYTEFHTRWEQHLSDVHCGRREFVEALQSLLLGYGLSWAQIDEVEAASRIQRQTLEVDVRPLPGVVSTIRVLNQLRVPLVAWADVPLTAAKLAERLERILPRAEFQAVVTSFEVECSQPDEHCYSVMSEVFAATACRTLYVGHDPIHLSAARQAGMLTAALSYLPTGKVDFALPRLADLAELASVRPQVGQRCPAIIPQSQIGLEASRQGECR